MILPWQTWLAYGVMFASLAMIAAYAIGEARGYAKGHMVGLEDGLYEGYQDGYRACLERARACGRTKEDEACDER